MISKEKILYSFNHIWQRKGRSFLTIFSIFIGITTIFIFLSYGFGLYDFINGYMTETSADKILIQPKGMGAASPDKNFMLTESDLRAVKRVPGVYEVEGNYQGTVQIKKDEKTKYVTLSSIDPESRLVIEMSDLKIESGRMLLKEDTKKVVLGNSFLVPNKIFQKPYELNQKILINEKEFKVIGFLHSFGNPMSDSSVIILNDDVKLIDENAKGYVDIVARVDANKVEQIAEEIEEALRKSRGLKKGYEDFYVASFEELVDSYMKALNIVIGFVVLIALISVVVSAVNTANTMITSVLERIKEIGTMKAIGARNSEILGIFLFESSFLGLVAGIIGVFFGFIFTTITGRILDNLGYGFLSPHYSWTLFLGCIAFATITGAISGVSPAINASRTNVVDSLRYE